MHGPRHRVAGRRPRRDAAACVGGVRRPGGPARSPGLIAEIAADPALHAALLERLRRALGGARDRIGSPPARRGARRRRPGRGDRDDGRRRPDRPALPRRRARRRLDRPHHRPAPERHRPMTARVARVHRRPGTSCSTGCATWSSRSSTGDRAVPGRPAVADGYRALATVLGVGLDTYLFAEPSRPVFMELITPFRRDRRWGGDNTDAYYSFAVIDPDAPLPDQRQQRGDSVYFAAPATTSPPPAPGRTRWSLRRQGRGPRVRRRREFSFADRASGRTSPRS